MTIQGRQVGGSLGPQHLYTFTVFRIVAFWADYYILQTNEMFAGESFSHQFWTMCRDIYHSKYKPQYTSQSNIMCVRSAKNVALLVSEVQGD